jgi:hypothetical protein
VRATAPSGHLTQELSHGAVLRRHDIAHVWHAFRVHGTEDEQETCVEAFSSTGEKLLSLPREGFSWMG